MSLRNRLLHIVKVELKAIVFLDKFLRDNEICYRLICLLQSMYRAITENSSVLINLELDRKKFPFLLPP